MEETVKKPKSEEIITEEMVKEEAAVNVQEKRFTKQQLLKSEKYEDRKDIVNALLKENRDYTVSETDFIIEQFMKGEVR